MEKTPPDGCRSVFRSGVPTKDAYTSIWVKLIHQMEKNKSVYDYSSSEETDTDGTPQKEAVCAAEGG